MDIFSAPRQSGKTEFLIESARETGGLLLVATPWDASRIQRDYPGIKVQTFHYAITGPRIGGLVYIDDLDRALYAQFSSLMSATVTDCVQIIEEVKTFNWPKEK